MRLPVTSFATYLIYDDSQQWRDVDHASSRFLKAIKGKTKKGYSYVHVRGAKQRLEDSNRADAYKWFAQMAADRLVTERINFQIGYAVVPFPNRTAFGTESVPEFSGQHLARELCAALAALGHKNVVVADILRYVVRQASAHDEGGTRDPKEILANLMLVAPCPSDRFCILVDDVLTSGGHLQAGAERLRGGGGRVWRALCAGRTRYVAPDDPFDVVTEELPDFSRAGPPPA